MLHPAAVAISTPRALAYASYTTCLVNRKSGGALRSSADACPCVRLLLVRNPTRYWSTPPVDNLFSLLDVVSEGSQADQPDLADFDTREFSSAQQSPQVLDVIIRHLGSRLYGCILLDN
jgi:hypothetical protein